MSSRKVSFVNGSDWASRYCTSGGRNGSLTHMNLHVHIEVRLLTKTLITTCALERTLLEVHSLAVDVERTFAAKTLRAHIALVWLLLEMNCSHMNLHIVLATKTLVAELTGEGLDLEMHSGGMAI